MQQKKKQPQIQQHDVDEGNRAEQEKTPPGSFTGTNTDRYVAGETPAPPGEEQQATDSAAEEN